MTKKTRYAFICVCVLALPVVLSLVFRFLCFSMPLLDVHGFRQTQTAITVREFLRTGYHPLRYITPIFGSQSSIPFEFPVYQSFCWLAEKATNQFGWFNLDQIGRLVNIGFFLLSAVMLYLLTKQVYKSKYAPFACTFVYVLMPASVFWSRTFMIEFCAAFFGLSYAYLFLRFVRERKAWQYLLALPCGILMYLTKVTSSMPVIILLAVMILTILTREQGILQNGKWRQKSSLLQIGLIAVLCLLPAAVYVIWNQYADAMKTASGLVRLTSVSIRDWNFGTWAQKTNPILWTQAINYLQQRTPLVFLYMLWILLGASLLWYGRPMGKEAADTERFPYEWRAQLLFLLCAVGTVFTFFNLYFQHDYYQCAVLPFLAGAIGGAFAPSLQCIFERASLKKRALSWGIVAVLTLCMVFSGYVQYYLIGEYRTGYLDYDMQRLSAATDVKERTKPDDLVLFAGFNSYSAEMPYYADRRGIMYVPDLYPVEEGSAFFDHLAQTDPVACIVLNTAQAPSREIDYSQIKAYYHLTQPDYAGNNIELYYVQTSEGD